MVIVELVIFDIVSSYVYDFELINVVFENLLINV